MENVNNIENLPSKNLVVAGIDVGSNAIRICIREYFENGTFKVLEKKRFPVRLGRSVFSTGVLDEETINDAVSVFQQMKKKIDAASVNTFRAVATSAAREAKNRSVLLGKIKDSTDIELEVISGVEEARLIYLAVKEKLGFVDDNWIIIDLGGGSVELTHASNDMLFSETKAYGAVRLLEIIDGKWNAKAYELLEDYINNIRIDPYFINLSHNGLIGTGGNIEELAKIINSKQNNNDSMVIKLSDLESLVMLLKKMSIEERISEFNLREDRADVILPAAMMFIAMCKRLGNNEIIVPGAGVRDGIVVDLYSRHSGSNEHENLWHPHLYESVENLGRKFGIDFNHAKYVTRVASKLFDQMRNLLGLDQEDGKYLDTAAMLHDIGQHISYDRHHKHSLYILTNSELPGFDKLEMNIIANIARYHRRAEPKIEHANFASLSPADQNRVRKLSAILRLADAMDSEHLQRIDKFTVNIGENEIELIINSKPSYSENIKIAKKGQMLEAITGKNLVTRELNDEQ